MVIALGHQRFAEIGLKSERGFGCLPCLFTEGDGWLKTLCDVTDAHPCMTAAPKLRANFGSNRTASLRYFCAPRKLAGVSVVFSV